MKRKKHDGRRNNGRPNTGLAEVTLGIRVPNAMRDAMAAEAAARGCSVNEAWRRAATTWLNAGRLTPEDVAALEG